MNVGGAVCIVDDDEAIREAVSLLVSSVGLETRTHASGEEFLAEIPEQGPACVLLDIRMPGMSGLKVQDRLQEIRPDLPVIFLTSHGDVPVAVRALKKGAFDFFEKPAFDRQELLDRVQEALRSHAQHLQRTHARDEAADALARLSPREREVMELIATGCLNKVIADRLDISERTVEIHRGRVMKKLGVQSVAALVRIRDRAGDGSEPRPSA